MVKLFLFSSIVALGLSGLACSLQAQDFSGTYSLTAPEGPMTLFLQQDADGFVNGTLATAVGVTFQVEGVVLVDEEDDEVSVEGTLTGPQGRGDFSFYADDEDDGHYLLITPYDASGTPRLDMATEYAAQRGASAQSQTQAEVGDHQNTVRQSVTTPPHDATRDTRLVGMWATQVIMNTPGGGIATQLFMEIRADGLLIDRGSRAMGSFSDAGLDSGFGGGGDVAQWRTQGNQLFVSYAGSAWVPLAQFEVSGNRLFLVYYDGDQKLWYRQ